MREASIRCMLGSQMDELVFFMTCWYNALGKFAHFLT